MKLPELSVIAPCFNEELNVGELTRRVLATFESGGVAGELVLVDDGSRDGTRAAIERLEAAHPGLVVGRFHPQNRGMAQAWKTGVAAARAPLVAVIDADLQYQPEDLLRLRRELLEHSVDVVQGWRSAVGRERGARYNLSRGFNVLLNATFGMNLRDNKSGFVMCSKEVMEDLLTYEGRYHYWQSFIMVAAHAKGYSYKEVETLFDQRRVGQSFLDGIAYRASMRSLVDLATGAWEYRLGRRPAEASEQFLRRHPVPDRSASPPSWRHAYWKGYLALLDRTNAAIGRGALRAYDVLRRTQWLAPDELRELQDEKLRRLVRHAYRNVPYYRERMRARGVRPEEVRTQADLVKLPFLTKDDVRDHLYFDILSENHDKQEVHAITTTGATGEPRIFFVDRAQLELRWAAALRADEWAGYRAGARRVSLWPRARARGVAKLRERLDDTLLRTKPVAAIDVGDRGAAEIVAAIEAARPGIVAGPAEVLAALAARARRQLRGIDAVMTSGQTLDPEARAGIARAFGAPVFDAYGTAELGCVAFECEAHDGYHVVAEGYVVELYRGDVPARPGEVGEIVVTDLNNQCLPFVRYRTGDFATARATGARCSCGRGLPLVGAVQGRPAVLVAGEGGRLVPGTHFAHLFRDYEHAVRSYSVTEIAPGRVGLRIVKAGRFSDDDLRALLDAFRAALGDVPVDVELLDPGGAPASPHAAAASTHYRH